MFICEANLIHIFLAKQEIKNNKKIKKLITFINFTKNYLKQKYTY